MVNLNRQQRTRAGDFFEKSATGLLVGTALAAASRLALTVGMIGAMSLFLLALWVERSKRRSER